VAKTHRTFEPILICYDGSPCARRAVATAASLFPGCTATVLHVWPGIRPEQVDTTSVEVERQELIEEVSVAARREAKRVTQEGTSLALQAGLRAKPLTVEAKQTAKAILQVARTENSAALVIGNESQTRLSSLLHPSLSRNIIDHSRAPVLVVPSNEDRTARP
jgi:nucleotide-binding universal stress UspA family protein